MNSRAVTALRQGSVSLPWRSLLLSVAAVAAYRVFGAAPATWVYDRVAIASGEWWRLISGHWVHSDPMHAAWDIGALLLLGVLFEPRLQWRLPLVLLAGSIAIDAWLWWGLPMLRYYCGLSGVLNSLLIFGLLYLWHEMRHPLILLTMAGAAMKIGLEVGAGQALLTSTAWPSVPTAHAAGFLFGLALASVSLGTWRRC